jgi:hypothetical protein
MAIPSELAPDLIDTAAIDQLETSFDPAYAAQLAGWGLPIRPAMNRQRRQRQDALDQIIAQGYSANDQRYDLAIGQLMQDASHDRSTLAGNVASALAETNEQGIAQLGPIQELAADGGAGLDQILGSGDMINRSKVLAEGAKAAAEAESEPKRAEAAMIAAQNSGGDSGGNFELEYNANGDLIGMKQKGKGGLPMPTSGRNTPTEQIFTDSQQQPAAELPSTKTSGRRLIKNSDGSGTIVTEDGQRVKVTRENMGKYGL